jgi:hypothetical protein
MSFSSCKNSRRYRTKANACEINQLSTLSEWFLKSLPLQALALTCLWQQPNMTSQWAVSFQ